MGDMEVAPVINSLVVHKQGKITYEDFSLSSSLDVSYKASSHKSEPIRVEFRENLSIDVIDSEEVKKISIHKPNMVVDKHQVSFVTERIDVEATDRHIGYLSNIFFSKAYNILKLVADQITLTELGSHIQDIVSNTSDGKLQDSFKFAWVNDLVNGKLIIDIELDELNIIDESLTCKGERFRFKHKKGSIHSFEIK